MAQADYIISNQTFPNTRADINSHLQAIATNNSGTSAPTTQYAGQFWIDTTSSTWTLYIHDGSDDIQFATIDTSANTVNFTDSALDVVTDTTPQLGGNLDLNSNDITGTGNINITGNLTASGNLTSTGIDDNATSTALTLSTNKAYFSDGTANTPSISNFGDGNTGMWFPASDTVGFSTGGSERMRIDSSGNVGIGTSSPSAKLDVNGAIVGAQKADSTPNNTDVSGVNSLTVSTGGGSQTINGLVGGVQGQVLHIIKTNSANTLTIADQNATSPGDDIYTADGSNISLTNFGGVTLLYYNGAWYEVGK